MKRKVFIKCIICVFLLFLMLISVAEQMQNNIANGMTRLHIIANSDEETDQQTKLLVRNAIIKVQKEIFPNGTKDTLNSEEKEKIVKVAENVLKENNKNYGASVEMGEFYFPTKKYENITLPAGRYNAVRVILGEGKGENWWCVMYPPLCFGQYTMGIADEKSLNILKEEIGELEYSIISDENVKIIPAFKLIESIEILKEKIRKIL